MNLDDQRIAIADAVGWTRCHKGCEGKTWRYPDDSGCTEFLPDYLYDLNDMHLAEKAAGLFEETKESRDKLLKYIRHIKDNPNLHWSGHASAAQRAEAFLRTLGLWKD